MRRLIYLTLCVVASMIGIEASAQMRSAYFMEGSYFRNELNPALAPTRGYIALPIMGGIGVNMNNNFMSVNNFFYKNGNEVVTALHESISADKFLGRLPKTGKLAVNLNTNILGTGFYTKKSYWNFGINLRSNNELTISKDIFKVLKSLGNGYYNLNNTSLSSTTYTELYIGNTRKIVDFSFGTLTAGAKLKFLMGLMNLSTDMDQIYANISSETVEGHLQGAIRANGLIFDPSKVVTGDEFSDEIINNDINEILKNISNFGAAIDLGAELSLLDERLRVSAAITDLGFIKWSPKTHVEAETIADFYFNGVDFNTGEADSDSKADIYMKKVKDAGYSTRLNCSLNLGAEYNVLNDCIGFGLLSHTDFGQKATISELTASVNFRPINWFSATVSHTLLNRNRFGVWGFALNLHPTGFNFFIGADYLPMKMVKYGNIPIPYSMKSLSLYMGIGFNIGNAKSLNN